MRSWLSCSALLLLLPTWGCGEDFAFKSACQRLVNAACEKETTCDPYSDFVSCTRDFQEIWFCDPSTTVEVMDQCSDLLPQTPCDGILMPEVCYDALCSTTAGCTGSTTTPTQVEGG